MKLRLSFDNPLNRKQRIIKTFDIQSSAKKWIKELMIKVDRGGMIILPVTVDIEYDYKNVESTIIFLSTLCEKHERRINNLTKKEVADKVTVSNKEETYERKSIIHKLRSFFR